MQCEQITLYPSLTAAQWSAIKNIARDKDVEAGSTSEHIFDLRENANISEEFILVWGRDGWRGGYYHGTLNPQEHADGVRVILTRGESAQCMRLLPLRDYLSAIFEGALSASL